MRILYLHQYFTIRSGSSGTRSYEFAKYLVSKGHQVTMITGDANLNINNNSKINRINIDGIDVIAFRNKYNNYMGKLQRIFAFISFMLQSTKEVIKRQHYDIIFATSTPLTISIPGLIFKLIHKKPFVFEVRDLWPEAPIQMGAIRSKLVIKLLKKLEVYTYNKADHIVALSPGMVDGIIKSSISESKISMIPNCSDLDLFRPDLIPSIELKKELGINNKFVVIHAGTMGEANGLFYVIKAAKILKEFGDKDIIFLLTGDGKTKPLIEKEIKKNNLDNVILTGAIPREKVPEYLSISDLTLTIFKNVPILSTNSPNKFFDAISAGKPVIVNTSGWLKDIVEKEQIGIYVDGANPKELSSTLLNLKYNPSELSNMGVNARKLAENQFNRITHAEKLESLLKNVIENSKLK